MADSLIPKVELIIEDGSGIDNANVYCDLDYADQYCALKGYAGWFGLSDDEKNVLLIKGTEYIDNYYDWRGQRKFEDQSLSFPRVKLFDDDKFEIRNIPVRLKKACIEAAFLNTTNKSLFITKDSKGAVKKVKADVLEKEYFENNSSEIDYTSIYEILNKLLKGLYKTKEEAGTVNSRAVWLG